MGAVSKVAAWLVGLASVAMLGCGAAGTTETGGPSGRPQQSSEISQGPARAAGRKACQGAPPVEIAQRFERRALRAGVRKNFARLVTDPPAGIEESPGYPRLVAAMVATTVSAPDREQFAAGCAEKLAAFTGGGGPRPERAGGETLP